MRYRIKLTDVRSTIEETLSEEIKKTKEKLDNAIIKELIRARTLLIHSRFGPKPENYQLQTNPRYNPATYRRRFEKYGYTNEIINLQETLKFKNSITIDTQNKSIFIKGPRNIKINAVLAKRKLNMKFAKIELTTMLDEIIETTQQTK